MLSLLVVVAFLAVSALREHIIAQVSTFTLCQVGSYLVPGGLSLYRYTQISICKGFGLYQL